MRQTHGDPPATSDTVEARPIDVCVIEDDRSIRELVTLALEDANLRVTVCPLGWEAHEYIRKDRPRLIVLDVQMPSVDGIQLFYLLRADPRTESIPVIFLTANPGKVEQEIPNYSEMGGALLTKPFILEDLLTMVTRELTRQYGTASAATQGRRMSDRDPVIQTFPGGIKVTSHHLGPELGYFWRVPAAGGQDWNGPHATPDDANRAAVEWLVRRARTLFMLEHGRQK